MDDSLVLVTEPCVPLEVWFTKIANDPAIPKQNLIFELHWGFKCVLQSLDFLHTNCSVIHGNLGLHSIFVTPNGDWKLGAFELATNMNNQDEVQLFVTHQNMLDKVFASPERQSLNDKDPAMIDAVLKTKVPPFYIDIYSFGQCVYKTFSMFNEELTGSFSKYIGTTVSPEFKKRPSAKKLVQTSTFNSDYIKILENVQEFTLKGPKEILEAIKQLDPLLPQMPVAICSYKVLPSVCRVLQISINDFQIRDSRESCRQAIVVCVDLLSKLGELKKLDESIFQQECISILVQLWTMTDRTIRTSMLASLKNLSELVPKEAVNKSIFDNVLAGFSDSNAKLRESTLMSLIYLVDKLDESHLQDRLVRCVGNLQNDPEASIRTNTTIFIGKIASKLKEPVRVKVLCNSLAKAMKDNFIHCRIAGLKTSIACLKFMDYVQLATKIIPQASILLLDRSADVRNLAISLMEGGLLKLKQYHEEMVDESKNSRDEDYEKKLPDTAQQVETSSSSWTSWSGSVLQGLSKTMEGSQIHNSSSQNANALPEPRHLNKSGGDVNERSGTMISSLSSSSNKNETRKNFLDEFVDDIDDGTVKTNLPDSSSKVSSKKGWDDDSWDDFGDDNEDSHSSQPLKVASLGLSIKQQHQDTSKVTPAKQWNDDLDDALAFDDIDGIHDPLSEALTTRPSASDNMLSPQPPIKSISTRTVIASSGKTPTLSSISASNTDATPKLSKIKQPKVAVKKLEVDKDDWEDF